MTLANHARSDNDHEMRLRSNQDRITVLEASIKTSSGNWREVWVIGLSVLTLLISLASLVAYLSLSGHPAH